MQDNYFKNLRSKRYKSIFIVIIIISVILYLIMALCGCVKSTKQIIDTQLDGTTNNSRDENNCKSEKINNISITTIEKEDKEIIALNITMKEFINVFDDIYFDDNGEKYFTDNLLWEVQGVALDVEEYTIETSCYSFSKEPEVRSVPQIKIYADSSESEIYQIRICYDDHSYSPQTYKMYEQLCYYTLKTLFPNKSDKKVATLNEKLTDAVDEGFNHEEVCGKENECVRMETYYAIGDTMDIRFFPKI